jgi:hypothetical protein
MQRILIAIVVALAITFAFMRAATGDTRVTPAVHGTPAAAHAV